MGILDMLKRGKSDSKSIEMPIAEFPELPAETMPPLPESSLPPLPGAEESMSIPDLPAPPGMEEMNLGNETRIPKIPDLPPEMAKMPELPEMPGKEPIAPNVPMVPEAKAPDTPNIPKPPQVIQKFEVSEIKIPSYELEPKIDMPTELPVMPANTEFVPEKIPPLEGIGEVPEFRSEPKIPKRAISPLDEMKQNFVDEGMAMSAATSSEMNERPARRNIRGPIFVKVSSFKDIMTHIEDTLARFQEEDDIFFRVTDIKNSQDKQYEKYRLTLEDMQRKLLFIDKTLFEKR